MATYQELYALASDQDLIAKVSIALSIAAEAIRTEDPAVPARQAWAIKALNNPDGEARRIMWLLMAQNKDATAAAISGASDALIQTAVDNAILLFAV